MPMIDYPNMSHLFLKRKGGADVGIDLSDIQTNVNECFLNDREMENRKHNLIVPNLPVSEYVKQMPRKNGVIARFKEICNYFGLLADSDTVMKALLIGR